VAGRSPTAVYVGGLVPGRGLEPAIDALGRLDGLRLRLVGPGSNAYRRELVERAGRCNVEDRVEFAGAVPPDGVVGAIAAADVGLALIQPVCLSYLLTLPNKLFEYIAAGVPILASDLPVMARFVRDHGVGVLVAPDDVEAIARGLRELVHERSGAPYREAVRRAARETRWERERARLVDVYLGATSNAPTTHVTV
jgi:glycosyltransferase involved in cell wall biosynthesis